MMSTTCSILSLFLYIIYLYITLFLQRQFKSVYLLCFQLASWREENYPTGFIDIRWTQTYEFGYVPNPGMKNVFMAVAHDLPDFDSPYGGYLFTSFRIKCFWSNIIVFTLLYYVYTVFVASLLMYIKLLAFLYVFFETTTTSTLYTQSYLCVKLRFKKARPF